VGLENFDPDDDEDVTPTRGSTMNGGNEAFILDLANENDLRSRRSPSAGALIHLHETSNIYESSSIDMKINLRNVAKSQLFRRDSGNIQDSVVDPRPRSTMLIGRRHHDQSASETLLIGRDLRIEDFARIGTDCVKVNLDKIRNESKLFGGRNLDLLGEGRKSRKSSLKQDDLRVSLLHNAFIISLLSSIEIHFFL